VNARSGRLYGSIGVALRTDMHLNDFVWSDQRIVVRQESEKTRGERKGHRYTARDISQQILRQSHRHPCTSPHRRNTHTH